MSLDDLDRYAELRSPGYAVLVTGPWGSGKTHQVERALIEPHQAHYVTLYGEPDVEAIHQAVLAAAGPWKERAKRLPGGLTDVVVDTAKLAGPAAGTIVSASGAASAPLIRRQLTEKINEGQLIVFDDLERSSA